MLFCCLCAGLCLLLRTLFCILESDLFKFDGSTSIVRVFRLLRFSVRYKSDSEAAHWWTNCIRAQLDVLTNRMVDYICKQSSEILLVQEKEGKYVLFFIQWCVQLNMLWKFVKECRACVIWIFFCFLWPFFTVIRCLISFRCCVHVVQVFLHGWMDLVLDIRVLSVERYKR